MRARAVTASLDGVPLVVLSHLRWDWVWQRPQHLVSRLAVGRPAYFVEQPRHAETRDPRLHLERAGAVTRVRLEVPPGTPLTGEGWGAPGADQLVPLLDELIGSDVERDVWLYAPTALHVAEALRPRLLAYDVMDDLAGFADSPPEMKLRMRRALTVADVVVAGGRSLHSSAVAVRGRARTHLVPSGVECGHYERSRSLRRPHARPVAGYVGVLDERLDLDLVGSLAEQLPGWDLHLVGPVAKIDHAALPSAPNVHYFGMQPYADLPEFMAGMDVALMPFALNSATRSISPTKTLEYLAAGLPVVSTRVPDVVADWGSVVALADTAEQFAAACLRTLQDAAQVRDSRVAPLRARHEWDGIADGIRRVLASALPDSVVDDEGIA